ncbi:hypothetical protein A3K34_04790 [candidate division WWE3 bacterium RIFOXYC1_FULL_40_10]|uniref:Uncharacterized protein n=1 Tax=candidate division WWE3 bacterium RIFOXYA2_FULL_46_9 TaxID=1802636 RepID=A0A1F4W166_UNCKA|nr:MAG: hypothetical protein A3K58_04790 [candidate division WWE3 bacterium RIFOXYB1_FULL_40_22]OGC62155.1 MAG: hypothetical protein A3K37_04790 [candidate division WWE3 bacterium RIFOXYA1_FULL_40_11]OGC63169.1 MAG: hypothetical protein A2264_00540 [candidate division WWE3 bacterium RIFOXYA2_FULL_46_9]OGC65249.1 MAG: hypothetical protein A2326_04175 [candidate division WWE3 bacterium RIFOXYB2_FULL_41_6]OGC66538.1 MAG: hypothetical protein A3K34_04790 [candidate division WWE3 bacterium RIFOXYC1_
MFSNIWFWIAVVELAIVLILVLLSRTHHKVQPTNQMARGKPRRDKNSVSKQTGTITNIYHGFMYFGTKPVTCIEVTLSGGDLFHLGIPGHDYSFREGATLEFWPTQETVTNTRVQRSQLEKDGTTSRWEEKIDYYAITRYRIVPSETGETEVD